MALKEGDVYYTRFVHWESGKSMNRRLHKLEVQAADGRVYTITGKDLPDTIATHAGVSHKGEHLGQILLCPKKVKQNKGYSFEVVPPWPSFRDFANVVLGISILVSMRFIASVLFGV